MRLISWNVNGLRACLNKGFAETFAALNADVFCVQETKMQPGQADFAPAGYAEYLSSAEKKGYSGTACWTRVAPLSVRYGIGPEVHSHEGRAITLEFAEFFLVNVYTPNGDRDLCTWRDVHVLFRQVSSEQLFHRTRCQPGRVHPSLPLEIRGGGGDKAG